MFNTFFTVILSIQVTFLFHFVGTLQSPSHCATVKNLILFFSSGMILWCQVEIFKEICRKEEKEEKCHSAMHLFCAS